MKFLPRLNISLKTFTNVFDPTSLRIRLTVGIAAVSILGLSGVVTWISWRMQDILVITHKNNTKYIAGRFPHDVEIYSDMVSIQEGTQKAIDNLTNTNTLLWVKTPQGEIFAQSMPLKMGSRGIKLVSLTDIPPQPDLQLVNGRYWLLCATDLVVKGVTLGEIYIAQDITGDQTMFLSLMRSLSFASLITIVCMTLVIAWYIKKSLQPLNRISQLTANISAEQLGEAKIQLENAPSEVKALAKTLETTLMRLSEAWEDQRQLVSNVSHELRTPLTVVSGYLQSTLRRGHNLTDIQREALETAASEADRTIQLLQDLLDLARADSGRMYFHFEPIILNELLAEIQGMVSQYPVLLKFSLPAEKVTVKADKNRLKQVLLNLIDNAVKYSQSFEPIMIKLDQEKGKVKLQICDRGIGIPLGDQTRIFERFYRVDEARSRHTGGTGLGLSIVKTLVEGMGGTIGVISQVDQGSTFTVILPLYR
ncbi:HAMP domain-containing sensor histidine kinase [Crocosphaera sp. UHCC 0190]|uniref:sensor histidine kinase n=1 Tax=Crocosphaera sp. UHCC 0190 TaxID=3110246 RepID=UPI002B205D80|nr:HAMP domain-containing sensor histidine kinase [Crocosphaera sp. UHCC 0190]MEA5511915.1 HAMP domain-containing sensor histidine kinase [Crocosphaera sp. UHCC 0190]